MMMLPYVAAAGCRRAARRRSLVIGFRCDDDVNNSDVVARHFRKKREVNGGKLREVAGRNGGVKMAGSSTADTPSILLPSRDSRSNCEQEMICNQP